MTQCTIDTILDKVDALPAMPGTMQRLAGVVSDPQSTFEQIVDTIRFDQTITSELLRLCNSAHFGLSRRVSSIDDAVRYLGVAKVLQLVMAAHCQALLARPQKGYGLPAGALWEHSVAVSLASELLAKRYDVVDRGAVFTAGLLHDVGKLLLNELVADEYAAIVRQVAEQRISFVEAERAVLGFDHAEVGAAVVERWGLPEAISRCIRHHYEPNALPQADVQVDLVHLADAMCILMGIGGGEDGLLYRADAEVVQRRGLSEGDFERLGAEVVSELKGVQQLFAVG